MADLRTECIPTLIDISESTTVSEAVYCQGLTLVAIEMPAAFTGTALTFQGDANGDGTYQNLYDSDGNQVSWTVAQGRTVVPTAASAVITGLVRLKVVSGSAEAADRTLLLHFVRTNQ